MAKKASSSKLTARRKAAHRPPAPAGPRGESPGAWSDEEIEATSRDSLMEENVDIAPEDAASSAPSAPEAIEVDPPDTPEDTSGAESETGSARPAGRERPSRPG